MANLTATAVKKAKPGAKTVRLFDGRGLSLEISTTGRKWWRQKYRFDGKEKRLALGVYPDVSLKDNNYMNPGFIAFNPDVAITMNPELNQLWITKKNSNVIGGEIDKVDLTCPGKAAFGVLSEKTLVQLGQYGYWADIAKTVYAISFEREVLR